MITPWQWSQAYSMFTISWSSSCPSGLTPPVKKDFPVKSFWERIFPNFKFTYILGKEKVNISKEPRRKMFDFISRIIYKILFWFQIQGFEGLFSGSYQGSKFYTDPCHCTADNGSDATAQFHHSHRRICPRLTGHSNEQQTCASIAINQHSYLSIIFWLWESFRQKAEHFPCQNCRGIF